MKTSVITLLLLIILSLVFTTDAYPRRRISSDILQNRYPDYVGKTHEKDVFAAQGKALLQSALKRAIDELFDGDNDDDDENNASYDDSYAQPKMRRKAVGLGDNPF